MGATDEISRLRAKVRELEAAAEINRLICDQLPVIVWTTDKDLTFTWMCGDDSASGVEPRGTTIFEYFHTTDVSFPPIAASLRALKGDAARYEHEWLGRWFSAAVAPLYSPDGAVTGTIGVALDITEQVQADDGLRSLDARHSRLLDGTSELVFTLDLSGRFTSANGAAERVLGYSRNEFSDLSLEDITAADAREIARRTLQAVLRTENSVKCEVLAATRTGERVALEITCWMIPDRDGLPVSIQAIARDGTHRKRMDAQLRRSQALEGTALLAAGIAEDLHDLLREILGSAYAVKGRMREGGASREAVTNVIEKAERASSLADHLLATAQQARRESKIVDVHSILRSVMALLMRTADPRIRIAAALDADRACVIGDENQIYQLFMNLAAVARDAMPEGGDLRITTSRRNRDLFIAIQGIGPGYGEAGRSALIEPIVDGSEPDDAARLAITVARAIVRTHEGVLAMDTRPGCGYSFHVSLPLSHSAARREVHGSAAMDEIVGRVLIIDDDPVVRRVLSRMVEDLGLDVAGSGDASDALRLYAQAHDRIDAVLLDAAMREVPVADCIAQLRSINADARIVVCSATAVAEGEGGAGVWWVEKPYSMGKLAGVMRSVLAVKAARTA